MSITTINTPQYRTSDGAIFAKLSDANLYQASVDNLEAVNAYLVKAGAPDRTQVGISKHILGYVATMDAKDSVDAADNSKTEEAASAHPVAAAANKGAAALAKTTTKSPATAAA